MSLRHVATGNRSDRGDPPQRTLGLPSTLQLGRQSTVGLAAARTEPWLRARSASGAALLATRAATPRASISLASRFLLLSMKKPGSRDDAAVAVDEVECAFVGGQRRGGASGNVFVDFLV